MFWEFIKFHEFFILITTKFYDFVIFLLNCEIIVILNLFKYILNLLWLLKESKIVDWKLKLKRKLNPSLRSTEPKAGTARAPFLWLHEIYIIPSLYCPPAKALRKTKNPRWATIKRRKFNSKAQLHRFS